MRFSLLSMMVLASLTVCLSANEHHSAKAKSVDEKPKSKHGATPVKAPNPSATTARELHQVEQQSKRAPTREKSPAVHQAKVAPADKESKSKPIHFGGTSAERNSMTNQGTNPYKGRVKEKGGHGHGRS
jgi:hypothetical protein